jgi:GntR family transcriptional regulator
VTVWCPEALAAHLSLADVERTTFHELLDVELAGATQTIAAAAITAEDAEVLGVPEGSPALVCERT